MESSFFLQGWSPACRQSCTKRFCGTDEVSPIRLTGTSTPQNQLFLAPSPESFACMNTKEEYKELANQAKQKTKAFRNGKSFCHASDITFATSLPSLCMSLECPTRVLDDVVATSLFFFPLPSTPTRQICYYKHPHHTQLLSFFFFSLGVVALN